MSPEFLAAFATQETAIEGAWRTLLNIEPVSSPLANPEVLQHLIPKVLAQILATVAKPNHVVGSLRPVRCELPACNCGNNPYRAFFVAGEQAIAEAAVLIQSRLPAGIMTENDIAELIYAIRSFARAEIDAFCGTCRFRGNAANCRFTLQS